MMTQNIFAKVDNYISDLFSIEDNDLQSVTLTIDKAGIFNASISPNQGKFLQILAMSCQAKRILEIGTLGAYSTLWLARALPFDGRIITLESEKEHAELARKNIEQTAYSSMIDVRVGRALDLLPKLKEENLPPFDMIFIDADKPPYVEYFQWALRLARPGSIIVADNVIRNAQVLDLASSDEKVQGVQRFNKMLGECIEVTATILQTVGIKEYDGMAIAIVNAG